VRKQELRQLARLVETLDADSNRQERRYTADIGWSHGCRHGWKRRTHNSSAMCAIN